MRTNLLTKPVGDSPLMLDWTNPLAQGLIACWTFAPGDDSGKFYATTKGMYRDLVYGTRLKYAAALASSSGDLSGLEPSSFGLGLRFFVSSPNGDGLFNADAITSQLKPTKEVSFFWRGAFYATRGGFNFTTIFRLDATTQGASSPFVSYGMSRTTNAGEIRYEHDAGGSFNGITVSPPCCANGKFGIPFSLGMSRSADGVFTKCYAEGIKVGSDTVSGNLTYSTPDININTDGSAGNGQVGATAIDCLYIWNRALSDYEHAWLDRHYYTLIQPVGLHRLNILAQTLTSNNAGAICNSPLRSQ